MSIAQRSVFALTLICFLSPTEAGAQQLYQPSSVSPWVPPRAWKNHEANPTESVFDFPQLLLDSTDSRAQVVTRKRIVQPLPMVETECFALLGQIRADKTRREEMRPISRPIAIAPPTGETDSFPSLGFLRASRTQTNDRATRL